MGTDPGVVTSSPRSPAERQGHLVSRPLSDAASLGAPGPFSFTFVLTWRHLSFLVTPLTTVFAAVHRGGAGWGRS